MYLEPLHDNVVIQPNNEEKMSAGGIVIPDNAQEKMTRGVVLAVGPGRRKLEGNLDTLIPTTLKVGAEVLYGKYTGQEVEIDGKKLLVTAESDILCVVRK